MATSSRNPTRGKAPAQPPRRPSEDEEEDDDLEKLQQKMEQITKQQQQTKEAMDLQQRLILQQREEAKTAQQQMMKQMEELLTNRLSPLTSINPTPATTPPPDPKEIPVPPPPPPVIHPYGLTRTPTIPTIDKLKGRSNYKTWTINIKLHARHLNVWHAIQGQLATEEQGNLAQSLIGLNVITAIQHQIEKLTAAEAWTYLEQRYNTRNICQITKTVQELCHINYDKFNSIETFQQRILTLKRQITEFTTSNQETFHVIMAAFILNGIG